MFKLGDLVCDTAHTVVGIVCDSYKQRVTIVILWNKVPEYQGCKTVVLQCDNVKLLPQGTRVIKHFKQAHTDELLYNYYDKNKGIIKDITGNNFTVFNVDGTCADLEFEFIDDVSTKNNKQYTTLDIEPWDIMKADFTKEEFIGFLKGNIIKYCLRKKGSDLQDFEKIEHYARKLQEVLKDESN
nr:MAG TPA: nucelotide kinase [Bacteriophage sp.]